MGEICIDDFDTTQTILSKEQLAIFEPILKEVKSIYQYLYIPKDISTTELTQLQRKEIQVLMGESLHEIIETRVTPEQINSINTSLNKFISNLSTELVDYSYRTPTQRQQNLKKQDVYNLIIQAFFNPRRLHKNQGGQWLDIEVLSSGEKTKGNNRCYSQSINKPS